MRIRAQALRAAAALVLLATLLVAPPPTPAEAVGDATAAPNCGVTEPGVTPTSSGTWTKRNDRLVLTCSYTDAALPPVFPRTSLIVEVTFGSITQTDADWQAARDGLFGESGWNVELGNPVDFVAESLFAQPLWDCTGGVRDPNRCKHQQGASARPHPCGVGGVNVTVAGVDGVPWLIDDITPPVEWELSRRVIQQVTANNVDSLPNDSGCSNETCTYFGDVTSLDGDPVLFAKVQIIHLGNIIAQGDTGTGSYRIVAPCDGLTEQDPDNRPRVRIVLTQVDGWYEVRYKGAVVEMESSPITTAGNTVSRDFDFVNIPNDYRIAGATRLTRGRWADWVEIYQNMTHSWAMSEQLGQRLDANLPIHIDGHCVTAVCSGQGNRTFAFWTPNNGDPYIALGESAAGLRDSGRPDNREYHEFGHHLWFDGMGRDNVAPSVGAHAGNLNASTRASLAEGFASWYAVMVNKHIIGRAQPHMYNPGGVSQNLEVDTRVFDGAAVDDTWLAEEFAIAGLLLDLEDGPGDYDGQVAPLSVTTSEVQNQAVPGGLGRRIFGKVTNGSDRFLRDVHVSALLWRDGQPVHATTSIVFGRNMAQRSSDRFEIIVPAAIPFDRHELLITENGPAGGVADDDPIDLTARQVWRTMRDYRRGAETGVITMNDVYNAFKALLGDVDADGNGLADVDQVFIAHGFYSRRDGNNDYNAGIDIIGRTDRRAGDVRQKVPTVRRHGLQLDVLGADRTTEYMVVTSFAPPYRHLSTAQLVFDLGGIVHLPKVPGGADGWVHVLAIYPNGATQVVDLASLDELDSRERAGRRTIADIDPPVVASGYRLLEGDGTVHVFGSATHEGDAAGQLRAGEQAIAMATTPSTFGYMVLTNQRRIGTYGDAPPFESTGVTLRTGERVTALSITPANDGYWVFSNLGRVMALGGAGHFGDLLDLQLNGEIIASVPTPSGNGYYLLGSDGGVFAFGDAKFFGSVPQVLPGVQLRCPVVGLVPTPSGNGYWMVACDGGVFAFGDASFVGSLPGLGVTPVQPINGMVAYGAGYLMVASDGGAFNFGAPFFGSLGNVALQNPITAITPFFS